MTYLFVGLGNPGPTYHYTRHNIGFRIADLIVQSYDLPFTQHKYAHHATILDYRRRLIVIKPRTYMNESGKAVAHFARTRGIKPAQILVASDDLHLPFGKMRLRPGGGSGGHNGIKSITQHLGTSDYSRLRFGIGSDFSQGEQADYVLKPFPLAQEKQLPPLLEKAHQAVITLMQSDIDTAMQHYN